jgi:protease-4
VDSTYRRFLSIVSAARKLPVERVDQIAQGRVWDGGTARQLQLVDRFGGLDEAIAEAARRSKAPSAGAVYLDKEPSFADQMLRSFRETDTEAPQGRDAWSKLAHRPQWLLARGLADAQLILSGPAIQARCLACPASPAPLRKAEQSSLMGWLSRLTLR